ncbi:MAG: ABC transporter ATP-binding protein [Clostridiales bacterium]
MGTYWRMIQFLSMAKKELLGKVLLGLGVSVTYVLQGFVIAKGVAQVFNHGSMAKIIIFISIAVFCIISRAYIIRYNEWYTRVIAAKVKDRIRGTLLDKLTLLGPGYQSKKRSGNLNSLITDGVEASEAFLISYIPQAIITFVTVVGIVSYLLALDWQVGLVVVISMVIVIIAPHLSVPLVRNGIIGYWQSYSHLNAEYIDAMQGMNTLKVFNAGDIKGEELGKNAKKLAKESIRNTSVSLVDSALIVLFMTIASSLTIAIATWHTANGNLSITAVLIILFLVPECVRPIAELNNSWHASFLGFSVAEEVFDIMDEPIVIKEKKEPYKGKNKQNLPNVTFENVDFSYDNKNDKALKAVNFFVKPGETVAVVGKSGAGKSTIVNLLLRFYDVSSGVIKFDGIDLGDYDLSYLRSCIAVVFQDTYLFYGTISENIRMSKPDATENELIEAAKVANIHDFIMALPKGYETIVGERGATLSGGERQRIAIARAVLKDASFLILDEATSSVDAANEKYIQDALVYLMQNRTTIVIAHRLSTIKNADKILVLEDGLLVEVGNHPYLMKKNGKYAQLINAQHKTEVKANGRK